MICDMCGRQSARIRRTTRSFGSGHSAFLIEGVPLIRCPNCHATGPPNLTLTDSPGQGQPHPGAHHGHEATSHVRSHTGTVRSA
jgi:YgiT-type zinc finger domain-containing protein